MNNKSILFLYIVMGETSSSLNGYGTTMTDQEEYNSGINRFNTVSEKNINSLPTSAIG
jgi:hypothetical protein